MENFNSRLEEEEDIIPPNDLSNIPLDIKKEAALKLSYPDLLKLCQTGKEYVKICRDPNFWKNKLIRDYPRENIEKLKGPQFRAKYERLYEIELMEELHRIYIDYESRERELEEEYKIRIRKLKEEKEQKLEPIERKIKFLRNKSGIKVVEPVEEDDGIEDLWTTS
jgi:hypothetical protein